MLPHFWIDAAGALCFCHGPLAPPGRAELIGNYKNGGTDYRPKGDPRRVKVHDFEDKELGKVVPYGVSGDEAGLLLVDRPGRREVERTSGHGKAARGGLQSLSRGRCRLPGAAG